MSPKQYKELMDQIKLLNQKNDARDEKIDSIVRGLYGDPPNKVVGLIERQEQDDVRHLSMVNEMKLLKLSVNDNTKFRERAVKLFRGSALSGGTGGVAMIVAFFKDIKEFVINIIN